MRRLAVYGALLAAGLTFLCVAPQLTSAAGASESLGGHVLDWAEAHETGHPYVWGGTGPGYDCSGAVVAAAAALGISLPHSTYAMLAGTAHLYRIPLADAQRGDLLFYGSGHVEFATYWWHESFGAQTFGTRVGWHRWSGWWQPTMAMRFR